MTKKIRVDRENIVTIKQLLERIKALEERIQKPTLEICKLTKDAIIPQYAHDTDSGFDIAIPEDTILAPFETKIIFSGLQINIPKQGDRIFDITIKGKSGNDSRGVLVKTNESVFSEEYGIREEVVERRVHITIKEGTVDNSYKGNVGIIAKNESYETILIPRGTKLAQAIVREVIPSNILEINKVVSVDSTERGEGGFGSTN